MAAMSPGWRKVVLLAHIITAVGWLGAVLAYVALDVAALSSEDPGRIRALWLARDLTVRYAILPLALASVGIGVVNALGTPWGMFRHYWVVMKFLLTLAATGILLQEASSISFMAQASAGDANPRPGSLLHSVGGLTVLLVITTLSVFKPRALSRYGWRKQQRNRQHPQRTAKSGLNPGQRDGAETAAVGGIRPIHMADAQTRHHAMPGCADDIAGPFSRPAPPATGRGSQGHPSAPRAARRTPSRSWSSRSGTAVR